MLEFLFYAILKTYRKEKHNSMPRARRIIVGICISVVCKNTTYNKKPRKSSLLTPLCIRVIRVKWMRPTRPYSAAFHSPQCELQGAGSRRHYEHRLL